jgi:hypothetical protein
MAIKTYMHALASVNKTATSIQIFKSINSLVENIVTLECTGMLRAVFTTLV